MHLYSTKTHSYKIRSGDSLWLIAQRFHTTIQDIAAANLDIDMNDLYIGQTISIPQKYCMKQIITQQLPGRVSSTELALNNHILR
jgi:LysM repeat protein